MLKLEILQRGTKGSVLNLELVGEWRQPFAPKSLGFCLCHFLFSQLLQLSIGGLTFLLLSSLGIHTSTFLTWCFVLSAQLIHWSNPTTAPFLTANLMHAMNLSFYLFYLCLNSEILLYLSEYRILLLWIIGLTLTRYMLR